ncbi:MAG: trigger factor [Clostridia bacterium]|nr:trigger factor [Clostridia bacterium]
MSVKNVTAMEKNQVKLELVIAKADFDEAVNKAFKKNASKITVPGFRKGKAPRGIIEKMYGKGVFYEDALNDILPEELSKAVEEKKLDVVSRPEIEVGDINDEGVEVTAVYYVKPEVTLKNYKGIEATKTVKAVTDEDVDHEIMHARERASRMVEVERPAEKGDFATIDYLGTVDGVAFDGGKDEGHKLELGSGSFIPGFEDQIIGHSVGDEFDVNVTFPEEYHAEDLKGKAAVFACKLHKLEVKELPALDDEFAKDVSEFDTLAEYTADVRANIEKRYADMAENDVDAQLKLALVDAVEADIPECMFENEVEHLIEDYSYRMQSQGISMEMYMKYTGMTMENFKEQFRPQAESQVKLQLALEKIVELEGIKATDEELDAEYAKLADMYKLDVEKIKASISADMLSRDVAVNKAIALVKENAKITEGEKKAPAKKTTAKKTTAKADDGEKAPAKKTTTKKAEGEKKADAEKAPAKKTTAKKTTTKAADGEKAPAKKTTTKKAPAKKADAE